jgi:hypothetical protein
MARLNVASLRLRDPSICGLKKYLYNLGVSISTICWLKYLLFHSEVNELDIFIDHFDNWATDPGHIESCNHCSASLHALMANNYCLLDLMDLQRSRGASYPTKYISNPFFQQRI